MATVEQALVNRVPLEELETTPEWTALTPKQKFWVTTYISSNYDALLATRDAFDVKSDKNARLLAYEVPENARVKKVLRLHFRMSPKDALLADLQKTMHRAKGGSKIRAMELYAKLQGWAEAQGGTESEESVSLPSVKTERFKIGEEIVQNGQRYRVTKLDPSGKVLDAEEM